MELKEAKKIIREKFPNSYYSSKKGGFVFRKNYFWGITQSSEPFANRKVEELKELGINGTIVSHGNNYKPWPKDSYFEAVIAVC